MAAQADVVPLLIHGFLDKGAIWKALTDHLGVLAARTGVRLPRRRDADAGPFTLRRQAAEAIALIDHRPEARFLVVGHSMGGQGAVS
jgi:pimeloyl-ACP methyl ester carboxylesterase